MANDSDREPVRGHTYSGIVTQDNARAHLGDVHNYGNDNTHTHNFYFCASSSQYSSQLLTFSGNTIAGGAGAGEPISLKRKRPSDENEYPHQRNKNESLEHVLSKLGKFSNSIQDQKTGKDAKKIAQRVALVLNAVKQRAGITKPSYRGHVYANHDEDDFETVNNCLIVARRVDVNTGFRRTRHTKLIRVVRKWDKITFEQWKISLMTSTFEFRNEDGTEVIESRSALYLDPIISGYGPPVTVHFGETTMHAAVSFINPVVLAYRIIPNESKVFELVRDDDLAGLITLLADGKATARDCDEAGATLLHVSERSKASRCLN
jgi:hypothetical protein